MLALNWLLFAAFTNIPYVSPFERTKKQLRIIGGTNAQPGQIPYQVGLEYFNAVICGAVLIKSNVALTAAHCTELLTDSLKVRAGTLTRGKGGVCRKVCRIFVHPRYNPSTIDYDISILKLCQPFELNKFINIIPIAFKEPKADSKAQISGWGRTNAQTDFLEDDRLKYAFVNIKARSYCKRKFTITERMICAEGQKGEDACHGDSGGPLIVHGKLVGLTSWGIGCGQIGTPGVYTNVAVLRNFIARHVEL